MVHGHGRALRTSTKSASKRRQMRRPDLEALETRWLPTLTLQFADAVGVVGGGSVDVESNAVANDASGDVYVTGSLQGTANFSPSGTAVNLTSAGNRDIFLAKYSATGALIWAKDLPGGNASSVAQGAAIAVDGSGNVYLSGTFTGTTNFDPNGGNTSATAVGRNDVFVAKYGTNGNLVWAQDIVGTSGTVDEGYAIAVDGSGNVVAAGSYQNSATFGATTLTAGGQDESFVTKLNASGQFLWANGTTGSGNSVAQAAGVTIDSSGNVISTGFYTSTVNFNPGAGVLDLPQAGSRAIFVQKLDANGKLVWAQGLVGTDINQANSVAADSSGNLYVTGTYTGTVNFDANGGTTNLTAGGYEDPFVLKLTSAGQIVWARDLALTGFNFGVGTGIAVDGQGNVFAAGYYEGVMTLDPTVTGASITSAGDFDAFLAEYNSSGSYVAAQTFGGPNFDAEFGIGVNSGGQVALAGRYSGPATFGSVTLPAEPNKSIFIASLNSQPPVVPPPAPAAPVLEAASDTGPSSSDGITDAKSVTFDVTSGNAQYVVELFRDGVLVTSRLGTGALTDPGPVSDGTHVYTAIQINTLNQASPASAGTSITVDTSIPATPTAPALLAADDSGIKGDGITNVTQPRLTGTIVPLTLAQLIDVNGNVVATALAGSNGSYTVQVPAPLAPGSYVYKVREESVAGNLSASSSGLTITILTHATTPPAPTLLAADDTGVQGDNYTNIKQPRLTGSATNATLVQIVNTSGTVLGSAAVSGSTYTVQFAAPLSDGVYTVSVQITDVAGNVSAASPTYNLGILSTPPAAPSTPALLASDDSGTQGDGITNVKQPHLTGTAVVGTTIQLVNAGGTVIGSSAVGANGVYQVASTSSLADGTYVLHTQAVDFAGNVSTASTTFTLTILTATPVTPSAPVLLASDDSGTQGDGITNVKQPHLTGTATTGTTVQILNASNAIIGSATAVTNGTYSVQPASPLADGLYVLHAQVVDVAGNVSAASGTFSLAIDTTAPAAPGAPSLLASDDSGTQGDGITNVKQPHLTGTAVVGTTVQLVNAGGTVLGSVTVGANGAYQVAPTSSFADGTYVLHTQAVDVAGNVSTASGTFSLTIDTTAPSAPSTPVLLTSDDSGTQGDGVTNVKQPHLTGTAMAGTTVQLLNANNVVLGSATGVANGTYSVQVASALADGVYVLHAQAVDIAGNVSAASATFSLTIDTTAPASPSTPVLLASDDSGTQGDGITNVKQPHLTGTAVTSTTVQLVNASGTVIGSMTVGANGGYQVAPTSSLADGTYVLHTQAVDVAGNVSTASGTFSVTILTASPATPSTPALLASDDSGTLGDGITNVKQPHLTGTAVTGTTVQLVNASGTVIGVTTVGANGVYQVASTSSLADGTYVLHTQAVDVAGNVSAATAMFALTILTATPVTPSTPVLLASDDSGTQGDGITNVKQPHLTGTATAGTTVQILNASNAIVGSATAAANGTYSVQAASPLADGVYVLHAQAADVAGNVSAASATFSLTIDTTAPAAPGAPSLLASDDSGTQGDGITNVASPHLIGTAPANTAVQIANAAGVIFASGIAAAGNVYTIQVGPLSPGTYVLHAQTTDAAGNVSTPGAPFTLTIQSSSQLPATPSTPTLLASDDSGTQGDAITNVSTPHLIGTATAGISVQIVNASSTVLGSGTAGANGSYSVQIVSPLADGTYALQTRAMDVAGNLSALSAAFSLTIDTTAPAAPSTPILNPADDSGTKGDGITNVTQPRLTGTSVVGVTIQLLNASGTVIGSAATNSDGTYNVTPSVPLAGVNVLDVRAVDVAGNVSANSGTFTLTIDSTAPAVPSAPVLNPADDSGTKADGITNVSQPRLTGTSVAGVTIQLLNAIGTVIGSTATNPDGTYSVTPSVALAGGVNVLDVRAVDVAGNVSAISGTLALTIDTTAPAAPSTPILNPADDSGTKGDGATNVTQPRLTGTSVAGVTMQLLNASGTVIGSAATNPDGTYSVTPSAPLAVGSIVLDVRAVDIAGNVSATSGTLTLTINTTGPPAPSTPVLNPADDSGTKGDNITNVNLPRLTGTAVAGQTVQLLNAGGIVIGSTLATASGTYSITPSTQLANGLNVLSVSAVDATGNVGPASGTITLTILSVPPAAPSVPTLGSADDTGTLGDNVTAVSTPHLLGSATAGTTIELLNAGNTVIGQALAGANGGYSVAPSAPLPLGANVLSVVAVDAAGNVSPASPALTITIVAAPTAPGAPSLLSTDDSGVKGDGITNVTRPHLVGIATAGLTVQLIDPNNNVIGSAVASSNGTFTVQPGTPLPNGPITLRARVLDAWGDMSVPSPSIALTILNGPPTTPSAPILNPADDNGIAGDDRTTIRRPRFIGVVTPGSTVELLNASGTVLAQTTASGTGAYTLQTASNMSTGVSTLKVAVIDVAGNVSLPSAALTITIVDTVPGDFTGAGKTELSVFRPSTAQWLITSLSEGPTQVSAYGETNFGDIPVPGDYDGTGKDEMAVFRPSTAQWFINSPTGVRVVTFGATNLADIPVPGDYDNVGYTEPAVFRPSTGQWFVLGPNGSHVIATWGATNLTDIPVPGDYDGVGYTEPAVYRPSTAQWFVLGPNGGHVVGLPGFGAPNLIDIPTPGDYDGVGHTEVAIFRPATAQWFVIGPNGPRMLATYGATGFVDYPTISSVGSLKRLGKVPAGIRAASLNVANSSITSQSFVAATFAAPVTAAPIVVAPAPSKKPATSAVNDAVLGSALDSLPL